jgi:hypothetical protein
MGPRIVLLTLLAAAVSPAAIVDRVAVVVGKTVFTESEVIENLRLTEFLNGEMPDSSPDKRREAAERLVDQELLRTEMKTSGVAAPTPDDADTVLQRFVEQHYHNNPAALRAALQKYGLTENELKDQLAWQVALVRFTDLRFRAGAPPREATEQGADRVRPGAAVPSETATMSVDQQMDQWLKDARKGTRIVFKQEAFR